MVIQLLLVILAAYAFARIDFPGKDVMFLLFVIQIMLPLESIIIPNYLITKKLGLLNTRTGLILPFVASGFGLESSDAGNPFRLCHNNCVFPDRPKDLYENFLTSGNKG